LNSAVRKLARRTSRVARLVSPWVRPGDWRDAVFTIGDFVAERGRLPRKPSRPDAGIMDHFFWRKHEPWSDLERRCCDKGLAKAVAQNLASQVKVPRTVATISLAGITSGAQLADRVAPFLGRRLVMKPAHSNGGVVFLDHASPDWDAYLREARKPFFPVARERQYHRLEPNVIIEEVLQADDGGIPEDYKLFCFHGTPLLCQIDYDRFTQHKRQLYLLPDWQRLDVAYSFPAGERTFPRPATMDQAIDVARALCAPFAFVRIDLYLMAGEVYFGEFTFTPDAGTKSFSDPAFDLALGDILRVGLQDQLSPFTAPISAKQPTVPRTGSLRCAALRQRYADENQR